MKTIYLLIISISITCSQTNAQVWDWTKPEPNGVEEDQNPDPYPDYDGDVVHDIEKDASGNIYVLGNFLDSLYLNNILVKKNNGGSYLAKYDSTGKLLWYKLIIPTYSPDYDYRYSIRATDLTVNATGVYITGKYDPTLYSLDCSTYQTTIGAQKSYAIANVNFTSPVGDLGLFITKLNSNGAVVWNKTASHPDSCYGGTGGSPDTYADIESYPIITSDNKNNIIAGFMLRSDLHYISIDGNVIQLPASVNNYDIGAYQLVVSKFSSAGAIQWGTFAGGGGGLNADMTSYKNRLLDCNSLISDKNNNIFFLGTATDSTFFGSKLFRITAKSVNGNATFISKISSAGEWQFAKELSNADNTGLFGSGYSLEGNPEKLAVDNSNNVYALVQASANPQIILGDTVNSPTNTTSCFLVKMNNNGKLIWVNSFGDTGGHTYSNSIHFNNNNLYICGSNPFFYLAGEKLVFSELYVPPVTGWMNFEYYIAKADINGNFQWVTTFQDGGYSSFGLALKAFNGNIYTGGNYQYKITSLGNLNGSFTNPNVYTPNLFFGKLKDQYVKVGVVTPTNLIPGCTITIPFTSYNLTFSNKNKFTAELSNEYGDFTYATAIGSVKSTGTGSINATIPASLTYGSGYRIRIRSSDTLKTGYNYYAYADTPYKITLVCPAPSSGFAVTNITATSAKLNWASIGCASGYRVQYRIKGTSKWTTAPVITTNTPTLSVTGLTGNTTYQWRVATKCKNNSAVSFSAYSAIKQFTTAAAFASAGINEATITAAQVLQLKIEPNPASAAALLVINGKVTNASVVITDLAGKTIWKKDGINTTQVSLPVQHFSQGTYMVKLLSGDKIYVAKLIKQ